MPNLNMKKSCGFTLIELALTIALLGIVTITAIPKVNTAEQAVALDASSRTFESDTKYAQSLASVTGDTHGVRVSNDNKTYTVYRKDTNGVETTVSSPHNHQPMQTDISQKFQGTSFSPSAQPITIEFDGNGKPTAPANQQINILNQTGSTKSIIISAATGRIDIITPPAQ